MDAIDQLRSRTLKVFDSINFDELNDRWVDEVVDNEFTDAERNSMTISILFVQDPIETLTELAEVCKEWDKIEVSNAADTSQNSEASLAEEVFWNVLQDINVNVKQILGIIFLLCHRAVKNTASMEEKIYGIAAVNFYFNCLKIPGSSAYSVFHPTLFCLCVSCMLDPDSLNDKHYASATLFKKALLPYISMLKSLAALLKDFHLGDDSNTVDQTLKKLTQLTALETHKVIKFDTKYNTIPTSRLKNSYDPAFIISCLAYDALSDVLESNLNGDEDTNYLTILSHLNKHILCLKARKSPSITQKFHVIKDNAVQFICHNLRNKNFDEFASEVTETALKRMCLGIIDKIDFRNAAASAFITILYNLKPEHFAETVQWVLLLVDSSDGKDRVFALEILGMLLNKTTVINSNDLPDSMKVYLTDVPIIFAILTRCDDISPNVRTRALTVLSQNMKCILEFIEKTKDQETFETEGLEEMNSKDLHVNGNHRFFWYNLTSLRDRLNEIAAILQRRIEDNNVNARKSAIVALENLMMFDGTYMNQENLKYFDFAVKDANIVVRKQVMQSLSAVLEAYPQNSLIQVSWLRCILPIIQDPESTVQIKALSVLEEQFLCKIFSSSKAERECSFSLLKMVSSGEFLSHQRYLQKAFSVWKSEKKLRPQVAVNLEKYINTEWEECVWFYLSNFAAYSSLPSKMTIMCVAKFQQLHHSKEFPYYVNHILKVLNHCFNSLNAEQLSIVKDSIISSFESFSVPVELIPSHIDAMFKCHSPSQELPQFSKFSSNLFHKCIQNMTEIKNQTSFTETIKEQLLPQCFCIVKELCQLDATLFSENLISLLKIYAGFDRAPRILAKNLTANLRAHALASLGKICLQDEVLAKELLPFYAQELLVSKYGVIRNNLMIILIEMCKRYTSFADRYVPLISLCFKDRLFLIRYQAIVLLVNLLQEGYIKWRGPLFFCLLSTLTDKKDEIQELGRYSLMELLHEKKRTLFSEHFVDSIFVFNGYPPPDNATLCQTVREIDRFAMKGEGRREERMYLFKFLLESMDVKERAYLVKAICEILMNVAEGIYEIDKTTECIVRDCFAILTCKEIRALNVDQISEEVDEAQEREFCKTELDTRRIVIVEPVLPVIVSLRSVITDPNSDLAHDLILFLKELLQDYKDFLQELLGIDKVLLGQVELELRNEAEQERKEKQPKDTRDGKRQVANTTHPEETIVDPSCLREDILSIMENCGESETVNNAVVTESTSASPKRHHIRPTRRQSTISSTRVTPTKSYNILVRPSLSEEEEIRRFASTPRVVLRQLTRNDINESMIVPPENTRIVTDVEDDFEM